jgi:hypothetical protein
MPPTPIPALGALSRNVEALAALVASCPSFQAWVGAVAPLPPATGPTVEQQAALRVWEHDAPADAARPFAIVSMRVEGGASFARGGANGPIRWGGVMLVRFEANMDESVSFQDSARLFSNPVGLVMSEMFGRSATLAGTYPMINSGRVVYGPGILGDRQEEAAIDDAGAPLLAAPPVWAAVIELDWGIADGV